MPTLTRKAGQAVLIRIPGYVPLRISADRRVELTIDLPDGIELVREESWSDVNPARRQPTGDEADRVD